MKSPIMGVIQTYVRSAYEMQHTRIQLGNRVVANFKVKLGQAPSKSEEESLEEEDQKFLDKLRHDYALISDAVVKAGKTITDRNFKATGLITNYAEFALMSNFLALQRQEDALFDDLGRVLKTVPFYVEYLEKIKGVGPAMAGVILSEMDPYKATYPSSFVKYAGIDTVNVWILLDQELNGSHVPKRLSEAQMLLKQSEDSDYEEDLENHVVTFFGGPTYRLQSEGRSRRAEHLVDVEYTAKDGRLSTKKSITYNPFLKTKLLGVLSGAFLKTVRIKVDGDGMGRAARLQLALQTNFNPPPEPEVDEAVIAHLRAQGHVVEVEQSPYAEIYYQYKTRYENHPVHSQRPPIHRHRMALRQMMKMFLIDLHINWRRHEGLPVSEPYHIAKLGLHHGQPKG